MSDKNEEEELMPGVTIRRIDSFPDAKSPEFRQWVEFSWKGRTSEGLEFRTTQAKTWAKLGDGDVCPGLELGLRALKVGERGVVRCSSRFAYGHLGRPAVTDGDTPLCPDSDVEFHIHIHSLGSSLPIGSMTAPERLEEARLKKGAGNDLFKFHYFSGSAKAYSASLQALDGLLGEEPAEVAHSEVVQMIADCGCNLAAAYLKMGMDAKAEDSCVAVLQIDPTNVKALFRAGSAAMNQQKFMESRLAFERLLFLEPGNRAAIRQVRELKLAEKRYRARERTVMRAMGADIFSAAPVSNVEREKHSKESVPDIYADAPKSSNSSLNNGAHDHDKGDLQNGTRRTCMLSLFFAFLVAIASALLAIKR